MKECPRKHPDGTPHGRDYIDEEGFCRAPHYDPQFPQVKTCWYHVDDIRGGKKYIGLCKVCRKKQATKFKFCDECYRKAANETAARYRKKKKHPKTVMTGGILHEIHQEKIFNLSTVCRRAGVNYDTLISMMNRKRESHPLLKPIELEIKKIISELIKIFEENE